MRRYRLSAWGHALFALLVALALGLLGGVATRPPVRPPPAPLLGTRGPTADDGDALPWPLQGLAMGERVRPGLVPPAGAPGRSPGPPASRPVVVGNITWGPARNLSMF